MRLTLTAETPGHCETDDHAKKCAINALREAIDQIEDGWTGGPVHDIHGNVIGNFLFPPRPP